jgi:hypothetical protein
MHSFLLIAILGQFSMGRIDGHLQKMNGVLPNSDPPLSTASFLQIIRIYLFQVCLLQVPSMTLAQISGLRHALVASHAIRLHRYPTTPVPAASLLGRSTQR